MIGKYPASSQTSLPVSVLESALAVGKRDEQAGIDVWIAVQRKVS